MKSDERPWFCLMHMKELVACHLGVKQTSPTDKGYVPTVHSKCINAHTLRSDISLPKCPTHSREMSDTFESQHPLSIWSTSWVHSEYLVGRVSGYLK